MRPVQVRSFFSQLITRVHARHVRWSMVSMSAVRRGPRARLLFASFVLSVVSYFIARTRLTDAHVPGSSHAHHGPSPSPTTRHRTVRRAQSPATTLRVTHLPSTKSEARSHNALRGAGGGGSCGGWGAAPPKPRMEPMRSSVLRNARRVDATDVL